MKATFPTRFRAAFLGKSREAGEFEKGDVTVSYGDAVQLAFEDSNGLNQIAQCNVKDLDQAADFDVLKLPKYAQLDVEGDVKVFDDGGTFKPTKVVKVGS
jgi:hypothetical protein